MLLIQEGGRRSKWKATERCRCDDRDELLACVWGVSSDDGGRERMQETRYANRKMRSPEIWMRCEGEDANEMDVRHGRMQARSTRS